MCPPQTACVPEERSNARKHPPKKKNVRLGRFEGKVGKANFGTQQGSFQAFSMGRKSSRRKQRGAIPRCGSHRTAMPTEERRGYGVFQRFAAV